MGGPQSNVSTNPHLQTLLRVYTYWNGLSGILISLDLSTIISQKPTLGEILRKLLGFDFDQVSLW